MIRIFLAILALVTWASLVSAEVIDEVAATVGNEVILRSEVAEEIGPLLEDIRQKASTHAAFEAEFQKAMKAALDQAIEMKILYRQAQLAGMQIEDKLVDQRLAEIRKRYPTDAEFQKMLQISGESLSDVRARLRKQIMSISFGLQKRREFEKQVAVSASDVAQYYGDHANEFSRKERVLLRRIFLAAKTPEERTRAAARLESLRKELELGANFGDLARRYSEGPEAAQGGRVGWVQRGDLVPALEEAAFALQPDEAGRVVETEFGVVLVQVEKRQDAGKATLDEVRTEIEPKLRERDAEQRYRQWVNELRERGRVRVFL
jgi:parvulin-like peptidyl-prolyl isomerase